MKKIITIVAILFSSIKVNAQFFEKDYNFLQVGYGIGLGYGKVLNAYKGNEGYSFSGFGPLAASYERAITDNIGLGLQMGYSSYGGKWLESGYNYNYRYSAFSLMARGAYHFDVRNRNFDPYGGIGIGFSKFSVNYTSNSPGFNSNNSNISIGSPLTYQIFLGARYMFNDNFGVYGEAGYGLSALNVGLTVAFD
jgi:opacity protein-like surface antigen